MGDNMVSLVWLKLDSLDAWEIRGGEVGGFRN